ncbi:ATP-dependent helicase [Candidatus Peregrinibacteria bacterium]|jgi:DNA helicase-2/ATP-dependent DNA helicase PcrA|nr:ATP-dependent helicase [Candidatus Peregrinibacteria bacterium]MBT5468803.1 ATP-dependent helicase [Candidatus Peregrinibacteria bacterium]
MTKIKTAQSGPATKNALRKLVTKNDEHFAKAYAILNEQQKIAVDTTDGPVMVVAGPGTGKTQVLALRTANILRSTQMKPGNILCLTFSKSGATAMRNRLREIIGPDAYGVTVNTIHGFCNDIIVSNPTVFEQWSSMEQISDVERFRSLNKIIDQLLPGLAIVNAKSPYMRTKDILGRMSEIKREGVSDPADLYRIADEYAEIMAHKSKEGTKVHKRNLLAAVKFRELIDIYCKYQEMLKATGRYDYEDMILNVIKALKEEDWLLASLQERYQYILVDEFQDTNGSQYELIELLSTDPTADSKPNIFVVGDDDQAIYRFQGANLKNILSFRERFAKAPVITLTQSYRCTQPILDAAENLISQNTERLVGKIEGMDKHLVAAAQEGGTPPVLLVSASDMSEPWMIADLVEERTRERVDPSEIAVLVQTNRELLTLYDVFKARSIPSVLSGKLDLLSHPLVSQAIAILQAIDTPKDNMVANALSCECFGCHPADLAEVFAKAREEKASIVNILLGFDKEDSTISLRNPERILSARDCFLQLQLNAERRTVIETLEHLYRDTGLLENMEKGHMDIVDFAAATEFFDRVKQRAYEQPQFGFKEFLNDIEYYTNPDYGSLRLTYDLPHLTESGVQLMTAHKSKGLEFHTVIISNFREGHWDKRRNPPSVAVPEDLMFGWEKDQKSYEKNQDERRVAFVAMTRAKRELIFTCPHELTSGDSTKTVAPSGFFAESGDLPEEHREVEHPEQMSTLLQVPPREFDAEFETFLRRRIEHFSLSPTSLNHFLEDPLMFLELDLLQRPQAKQPHFAYGNAIHHVMAKWADGVSSGSPLSMKEGVDLFTEHLNQKELLTNNERDRLTHLGINTLTRYFETSLIPPYPVIHKVEFGINARIGDIPIKGKIDRIDLMEPNSTSAIIIDFKTGKPKTEKQIVDYGYFRQLVFYGVLIEAGYGMLQPKEYILDFVGESELDPIQRRFTVSEQDKIELKQVIEAVWTKILALDFTPV